MDFTHSPTKLIVDLDAIAANWRLLRDQTSHRNATAVVKANGYGMGVVPVAQTLAKAGCTTLFTAHLDEALEIDAAFPDATRPHLFVLNGFDPSQAETYKAHRIGGVLNDLSQIDAWRTKVGGDHPAIVHIDTGMARLGLDAQQLEQLINAPERLYGINLRFFMSHMACADTPNHPLNEIQRQRFKNALNKLPPAAEGGMLAASSATFLGPNYHFDAIRPGVAIFGGRPNTDNPNPLKQVIKLEARLLQVRQIDAGDTVGYGASHLVDRPSKIATIALGYADGFSRALSSQEGQDHALAFMGSTAVPIVGRISMDLVTLDVTDVPSVQTGDTVSLINDRQTVDDLADRAGTIGYELLTSLGRRFQRSYTGEAA